MRPSLGLIGVTVAISLLTLVILLAGRVLRRLLGDVGLSIATRILGLLVAAIGMQFVITGLSNVIVDSIAPAVLKSINQDMKQPFDLCRKMIRSGECVAV
jgi:multiple antibiotic resistance protein